MKKIVCFFASVLVFTFFNACGPSAAEQAQIQQQRDDSIRNAVERKHQLEDELEASLNRLNVEQDNLKMATAQLEVERDNMDKVKDFRLLRTHAEREEQIKNQSLRLQNAEESVRSISQNVSTIENSIEKIQIEIQKYK